MTIRRVAKLFAAQNANQLVLVLTQLLLPAAFVRVFGRAGYGEWITLTAAVAYLNTLNYGPQTYTNMQMTILYNRGEFQECRHVQSAGLRILLTGFCSAAVLLLLVFLLPLQSMLQLTITNAEAHWTLYIMGVQVMAMMLFGFFSGSYMVFGEAHLGAHAANINQLLGMLAMVTLIYHRQPFHMIALAQLSITLTMTLLVLWDLSRRKPELRPTVQYWQKGALGAVLRPSSQYMLLASSYLIAYQVPALLMAHFLGPDLVAVFSLTRTIYSMSRRLLFLVTNSLQAEITLIYGQQDWERLVKLYSFSERIILLLTPPITFGSMLATPVLMQIWLHRAHMFDPAVCIALGLTVSVLSIKEHKYQFQFSSNKVSEISWLTLVTYAIMSLVSIPLMIHFGLIGFIVTWLVFETGQFLYLLSLNDKLFVGHAVLNHRPVWLLFVVLAVCTAIFWWPMFHIASLSFVEQGAIAILATLVLSGICYRLFQVDELRSLLWSKLSGRFPALTAKG